MLAAKTRNGTGRARLDVHTDLSNKEINETFLVHILRVDRSPLGAVGRSAQRSPPRRRSRSWPVRVDRASVVPGLCWSVGACSRVSMSDTGACDGGGAESGTSKSLRSGSSVSELVKTYDDGAGEAGSLGIGRFSTDGKAPATQLLPSSHGSLETFGGPQRHAIDHLKAGKMVIPNMSSVMLGKSVLLLNFNICITSGTIYSGRI